jgi:hypothetical protein
VQLDTQGLLALLRQAKMLPIIGVTAFMSDRRLTLNEWLATFSIPRDMMTPEKLRQQLEGGALADTEWHFGQMVTTDGTDVTFHFRRMLTEKELERVRAPPTPRP